MSIGISELARSITYMRQFLESRLTPELMAKMNVALNTIQNTLGNPALQASARNTLNKLDISLSSLNSNDTIKQISDSLPLIQATLNKIDPITLGETFTRLNDLLAEADKAKIISEIIKTMETVNLYRNLVDIAIALATPAKVLMYAFVGAQIAIQLHGVMKTYSTRKEDKELQQVVVLSAQQLRIQSQKLKMDALNILVQMDIARHQYGDKLILRPETLRGEIEALNIVNKSSVIRKEDILTSSPS